ncbi:MAG: GlsB/YeaQ/YmgE family stress response membrane protein [Fimbriiglobus sp.]|nr:GlsB/YeaQ/YmgE family stress response membrane protein [Fimbriiglobus sp.]
MLAFLSWIVTGLIVGLIARAIVPGRQGMGWIMTILLGIAGAIVGGLISSAIWRDTWAADPDISTMWPGWIMSVIGGIIVLGLYVFVTRRTSSSTGL